MTLKLKVVLDSTNENKNKIPVYRNALEKIAKF
jgi:hypothetical protein